MGLFKKNSRQDNNDSVYNRRVERGEIPNPYDQFLNNGNRIKELQKTVRELTDENSKLKDQIGRMKEYIDGLHLSMSIEETIKGMKEDKNDMPFNPFSSYASAMTSTLRSTYEEKNIVDDNDIIINDETERVISDEEMERILDYLDGNDSLIDGEVDEPDDFDESEQDEE